jgi:hypothetical protein
MLNLSQLSNMVCSTVWQLGDRDGELSLMELASLLRDLGLKTVSNADIMYFMVSVWLLFKEQLHFAERSGSTV